VVPLPIRFADREEREGEKPPTVILTKVRISLNLREEA